MQQVANGAVYDEEKKVIHIHDHKLDALEDLIESANGQPVLVFYSFLHDKERIKEKFPNARELNTSKDIDDWNSGKIPVLVAHPASIGHGLNLQYGGHIIVWYGLTWSLELYLQANDRLHRQGQQQPVTIYRIVSKGTVDERILKVLDRKEKGQNGLMEFLKERVKELRRREHAVSA